MELRQLRYFVAVAEELHFTRAAERLNIGQPPLSLQIQAIERELGVALLKRTRRKVELTPAGEQFLQEARLAIAQFGRAVETAKRAARGEVGSLRLAYITSLPMIDVFTRGVRRFRSLAPDVHLDLAIRPSQKIIDEVLLKTLDIGFVRPASHTILPRGLTAVEVHLDQLMIVVPIDHPLSAERAPIPLSRLQHEKFVLRPRGGGAGFYEQVFAMCGEVGYTPDIVQEAVEATTILGLVAAGVGITVAPQALQSIRISDLSWHDIADEGTDSRVLLIVNREVKNPLRDRFIDCMKGV